MSSAPTPPPEAEVLRFALAQGPLRGLLLDPIAVDERVATTALLPPAAARGRELRPLPAGTFRLLEELPFGGGPVTRQPPDRLGHLLVAALGMQRREPSNPANDHRAVASVRSKFPVHVLVVGADGRAGYLDLYRHALVAVDAPVPAELRPPEAAVRVVLAARPTDLPTPYGILRRALGDLELGINLRAVVTAAELFGCPATVQSTGPETAAAERLMADTGPGCWSVPVVVTLHGTGPFGPFHATADDRPVTAEQNALLPGSAAHPTLTGSAPVAGQRRTAPDAAAVPAAALPKSAGGQDGRDGQPSWAEVLWNRGAGRVPSPLTGFSVRPGGSTAAEVDSLAAWAGVPVPPGPLTAVREAVSVHVVLQRTAGLPDGHYRAAPDGGLALVRRAEGLAAELEEGFGYPLAPGNDRGVRHASSLWFCTVDLEKLIDRQGPAAWSLLHLACGWLAHGLSLGAAAQGRFARPARSFDEHLVGRLLELPDGEYPVLLTICGRTRYAEPYLDLRV
ncbi:hypothetical protein [Actinacidiphila yeochonensis]|uniref:hypothetical protein n=1 Tax=Actinacidiphila yeochonensis TaxID=89050 RepID=UPI00068F2D5C|nr:hypothetical protein [Actinacidiphila yeochonensis]